MIAVHIAFIMRPCENGRSKRETKDKKESDEGWQKIEIESCLRVFDIFERRASGWMVEAAASS